MLTTFGLVTPTVMIIVLVIALIIFGPGKLPQMGQAVGKAMNNFKKAREDDSDSISDKSEK